MRVVCPSCKKINQSSRARCAYCERDLAGATLAAGEESQYYGQRGRRFPWGWFWLLVVGGGAAGYWYWYVPMQRGKLVREVPVEGSALEKVEVSAAKGTITVRLEGAKGGRAAISMEHGGKTVGGAQGALPLEVRAEVGSGLCLIRVSESPSATLRVWVR